MIKFILVFHITDCYGQWDSGQRTFDTRQEALEHRNQLAEACCKGEKRFDAVIYKAFEVDRYLHDWRTKIVVRGPVPAIDANTDDLMLIRSPHLNPE